MTTKPVMLKLDEIGKDTANTRVEVARIEEHLKNLNGSVQRHERNINELYNKTNDNKLTTGKLTVKLGIFGTLAGLTGAFILNLLNKLWR